MLKELPEPELDQARRLIKRAVKDLATAKRILGEDEPAAMDLIYKGVFHAANSLLRLQGYRPGLVRQHQGVVEAMKRTFGERLEDLVLSFDRLRKRRNQFEYQAVFSMSTQELQEALKNAQKLIKEIEGEVEKREPQLRLKLRNTKGM